MLTPFLASVLINLFQTYLETAPTANTQFWYLLLMGYNETHLHQPGASIRDDMVKVKFYKTIVYRLRHSFNPINRWFGAFNQNLFLLSRDLPLFEIGRHCDELALQILHNYTKKFNLNPKIPPTFMSAPSPTAPPKEVTPPEASGSAINLTNDITHTAPPRDGKWDEEEEEDYEDDEVDDADDVDSDEEASDDESALKTPAAKQTELPKLTAEITAPIKHGYPTFTKAGLNWAELEALEIAPEIEIVIAYSSTLANELSKSLDEGRLADTEATAHQIIQLINSAPVTAIINTLTPTHAARTTNPCLFECVLFGLTSFCWLRHLWMGESKNAINIGIRSVLPE